MYSTRSLIATLATKQLSRSTPAASLHTVPALAEEKRGFLSRLNPFAKTETKPVQPHVKASELAGKLNVEIEEDEDKKPAPSWKSARQILTADQLEESIRSAASPFLDTSSSLYLNQIKLGNDPRLKFKVLKACVVSTGHEIPNKEIASIHNLRDVFTTLQRLEQERSALPENPQGHIVAEWFEKNKTTLPSNMIFIPYQKSRNVKKENRTTTNKRFL
ncbi:hypothetical protein BX616_000835 [Lobosporangium transversale]|uniref:Large ribosomal subunit protein mL50 n=1 Tax=Lobosporangium transversale TaxID=64571 RepID=A0A1Y2H0K1_9FUNG|nr:hypothetical protein BCR41DRAFT_346438 [Lobosporangium transversale]KAF9919147.1 hypothetical protein BX616_000835 [Lobosporangium transversale]ORZ28045.1 hypothetical protein BCR41DRAFT_346438 [Lobosporangium transversale]|eukprot:XP_021885748.1 hypothetical protein BCR41DRAFT_346438 [Lobosporangium transversale]